MWRTGVGLASVWFVTHPRGHFVDIRRAMVIVEHHNSQHHRRCDHEHDAVEIGAWGVQWVGGSGQWLIG